MNLARQDIETIVRQVVRTLEAQPLKNGGCAAAGTRAEGDSGLFETLDEAVTAATDAYKKISTIAIRETIVATIRKTAVAHAAALAEMAVEETGMGRVEDKTRKNILQARKTPGPEILSPAAITGDAGMTLIENAPWGVIASVTPSTNPAATVINNAISMISAGNSVVFAPHPGARKVTQKTIQLLNQAIIEQTGITNLLTAVREPSIETAKALFSHPGISLLVVTGGEAVVETARKHATMRLIAAGAGNPPVVVDETADIQRAARSIYDGASFDNNIICADEKIIIAVESIADALLCEMAALGAKMITLEQAEAVARVVFRNYPGDSASANPQWVGRDAPVIARAAGIEVPASCRLLVVDAGRNTDHPFARIEQMMPVLPLLRAKDVHEAIDWACLLERNLRHTAGMHSTNINNMDCMARRINTSLFVKNGPHIAGLGAGGEGWTSMTISTPTGEGVTCARSFVRLRRCALVDNFRIV